MGCGGSKEARNDDPPAEPIRLTGRRKRGQTACQGPASMSDKTSRGLVESSSYDEKDRGRSRSPVPDEPPSTCIAQLCGHIIEGENPSIRRQNSSKSHRSTGLSRSTSRGRSLSVGSKGTEAPRARPGFSRMTSGYRKAGQHGRSDSQVRREQEALEEQKLYIYTGPPLQGKRRPGQVPPGAMVGSEVSSMVTSMGPRKKRVSANKRRSSRMSSGPLIFSLDPPEQQSTSLKDKRISRGFRHPGESAAAPAPKEPLQPPPGSLKDHSGRKGKRKSLMLRTGPRRRVTANHDSQPPPADNTMFFYCAGDGYD
ncbi:hypothetical protein MKZ38_003025 [Zalerion maritima]|uniref:Uncharacterized protein n=1 Tax=Zalerion maritima TaxID=339359 RepID=A0AAD5WQF3_9PEZI|nr:hypothetical protein MKZ38_003025 [Zalerion maritima]